MREPRGYSLLQVALHWTIVVLIAFQLLFHDAIGDVFDDRMDGDAIRAEDQLGAMLHVAVGASILVLAIIRILVRLRRGAPPVPPQHNAAMRFVATATHVVLYGFIFLQPLSGASAWFLGVEMPAKVHTFLVWYIFAPVVALHIAGALAEHFVFRTNVLRRMLKPER
jgi:cytochrome b561